METKFLEIIRILAHLSEKFKSLADELDKLYSSLTDAEIIELFKDI